MAIYTKTGDKGETSLFNGTRVSKSDLRIELLGLVDETNSFVGLLINSLEKNSHVNFLSKIQSTLFDIGSEIANPSLIKESFADYDKLVRELEQNIDDFDSKTEPLHNFILPGGSYSASLAHICRVKARAVERKLFSLDLEENNINPSIGRFLNRLSDYFFSLARILNKENGVEDVIWRK